MFKTDSSAIKFLYNPQNLIIGPHNLFQYYKILKKSSGLCFGKFQTKFARINKKSPDKKFSYRKIGKDVALNLNNKMKNLLYSRS